jgi:hypothetical protein
MRGQGIAVVPPGVAPKRSLWAGRGEDGQRRAALRVCATQQREDGTLSVGEVVFSGVALGVLVLYPFIFRWAGLEPDPFDERQVARRRNCRVLVFTVPGLILVQVLRLVLDISNLH